LIRGERAGVEMRNTSRCAEIDKRFLGLIGKAEAEGQREVECGAPAIPGEFAGASKVKSYFMAGIGMSELKMSH
jgi:hypothetical protein